MKQPELIIKILKLSPIFIVSCSYSLHLNANDKLIAMCDSCHGNNGVSLQSDIPTIAACLSGIYQIRCFSI